MWQFVLPCKWGKSDQNKVVRVQADVSVAVEMPGNLEAWKES